MFSGDGEKEFFFLLFCFVWFFFFFFFVFFFFCCFFCFFFLPFFFLFVCRLFVVFAMCHVRLSTRVSNMSKWSTWFARLGWSFEAFFFFPHTTTSLSLPLWVDSAVLYCFRILLWSLFLRLFAAKKIEEDVFFFFFFYSFWWVFF